MSDVSTFAFDNEEIRSGMYDRYKGTKGTTDRLAIVYQDPKAMFAGVKCHYKDRYFVCKKGLCCEKLGAPKWRVGAVVVKYATDKQGMIKKPFSYELMPWSFGEQTYVKLKNVNSEFPLASHDIKVTCTNDEYQHLDITPCNEVIWTAKEEIKGEVLEAAKPIWDFVKKSLASELSVEEIKELLSVDGGGSGGADPTSKLDLDKVLDQV